MARESVNRSMSVFRCCLNRLKAMHLKTEQTRRACLLVGALMRRRTLYRHDLVLQSNRDATLNEGRGRHIVNLCKGKLRSCSKVRDLMDVRDLSK